MTLALLIFLQLFFLWWLKSFNPDLCEVFLTSTLGLRFRCSHKGYPVNMTCHHHHGLQLLLFNLLSAWDRIRHISPPYSCSILLFTLYWVKRKCCAWLILTLHIVCTFLIKRLFCMEESSLLLHARLSRLLCVQLFSRWSLSVHIFIQLFIFIFVVKTKTI